MKKLLLNKETIARLDQGDVRNARGGTFYLSGVVGVQCFGPSDECTQDDQHTCHFLCDIDWDEECASAENGSCKW